MGNLPQIIDRSGPLSRVARTVGVRLLACAFALAAAPVVYGDGEDPAGSKTVSFNRDVRPILADKCFKCHGPDARERKGKLRLDNASDAQRPAATGSVPIVPGNLDDSELYQRIISTDPELRMPPPKSGKVLSNREVDTLKMWIKEGAQYQPHWAFLPPERPALPVVKNVGWCRTPIDRFILARLEAEGLAPSPEADRVTLIRRLSLDIVGLPPSIHDVDAFQADRRTEAYASVVERLLESPHYGERWGRIWLDAARYADSDGYEKDKSRQVYFYRDWVIRALNRDLPYNQFIIEQIAGDQLPAATQDQVVATGFLRNSMINEEGGVDPSNFEWSQCLTEWTVSVRAFWA